MAWGWGLVGSAVPLGSAVPVVWAGFPQCRVPRCIARKEPVVRWASPGLHDLTALYRGPTFLILDICTFDHMCGHKGIREGNERTGGEERGDLPTLPLMPGVRGKTNLLFPKLSVPVPLAQRASQQADNPRAHTCLPCQMSCMALGVTGYSGTRLHRTDTAPKAVSWVTLGLLRGVPTASSCIEC